MLKVLPTTNVGPALCLGLLLAASLNMAEAAGPFTLPVPVAGASGITNGGAAHKLGLTPPTFEPRPGDIVASSGFGIVLKVDPITGMRSLLSDFTNASQGPTGFPGSLTAGVCGAIYATDQRSDQLGKLFRIFPNGTRALVSDATNAAQGPAWYTPYGLGLDTDGSILVTDRGQGGGGNFAGLWSVNPNSGVRSRITDSGAVNGTHSAPESVMLDADGNLVLGDVEGPHWLGAGIDCSTLGDCGALFRVDRLTGALTVLSDFGNLAQGPLGEDGGHSIALEKGGRILVVDAFAASGEGALFRVDLIGPPAGTRTQLTTGLGHSANVAVDSGGTIFLGACATPASPFGGVVCSVDRTTGVKTVLSDFDDPAQGPTGYPYAIAVVGAGAYPFADSQVHATALNTSLPITLTGSDPGALPLTFRILSGPAHGSLTGIAPNVTYNPDNGYNGPDTIMFLVNNGCGDSSPAIVAITVGPVGTLDIDSSVTATKYDALTDGLLIIRYLFGLTGPALTAGALGGTATRTDPAVIKAYLDGIALSLDIDGNGTHEATTDGLLILRYMFGLRGSALIAGAAVPAGTRKTALEIETYIQSLMP